MGDQADYLIEEGLDALDAHKRGECEGYCLECYEELTEEEKKSYE